jgi:hypothetical protein
MIVERRTNLLKGSNQFSARTIDGQVVGTKSLVPTKSTADLAELSNRNPELRFTAAATCHHRSLRWLLRGGRRC